MANHRKLLVLLFSGIAITAILLLAGGLSDLELGTEGRQPGRPHTVGPLDFRWLARAESGLLGTLLAILGIIVVLFLPMAVWFFFRTPLLRKQFLRDLILVLWLVAIWLALRTSPEIVEEPMVQPNTATLAEVNTVPAVEAAPESLPSSSDWLAVVTTCVLAGLLAAGLLGVVWLFWRRGYSDRGPLEGLAREAQAALLALESGEGARDTVMRCYFAMNRVLQEQRGIKRAAALTPREFASQLRQADLPDTQIEQLTGLFERVRYGAWVADEREERHAVECLRAIAERCKALS